MGAPLPVLSKNAFFLKSHFLTGSRKPLLGHHQFSRFEQLGNCVFFPGVFFSTRRTESGWRKVNTGQWAATISPLGFELCTGGHAPTENAIPAAVRNNKGKTYGASNGGIHAPHEGPLKKPHKERATA